MPNINFTELASCASEEIKAAASLESLEDLRIKYLGRKGVLAELTAGIPALPIEERREFGQKANELKASINSLLAARQIELRASTGTQANLGCVDIGLPGISQELGHLHPITQVINEICAIFVRLGFSVVEGPEIETEYNNFTGLNIPLEHPSREAFDTFYIKLAGYPVSPLSRLTGNGQRATGKLLLRSHTSPVQIRVMKAKKPPLAVVVPGRVFRPDALDASHSFMFHQVEGFLVDKDIKFSDLKGVLQEFARNVFNKDIKMRLRPHFFPFTEPSAEVDISCIICGGHKSPSAEGRQATLCRGQASHKCSVCGGKGWLEVLGAGMIHPNVFKNVGYDPKKYTGFAFGMGIERIAMLKFGINDIRMFYENDLRFLRQF